MHVNRKKSKERGPNQRINTYKYSQRTNKEKKNPKWTRNGEGEIAWMEEVYECEKERGTKREVQQSRMHTLVSLSADSPFPHSILLFCHCSSVPSNFKPKHSAVCVRAVITLDSQIPYYYFKIECLVVRNVRVYYMYVCSYHGWERSGKESACARIGGTLRNTRGRCRLVSFSHSLFVAGYTEYNFITGNDCVGIILYEREFGWAWWANRHCRGTKKENKNASKRGWLTFRINVLNDSHL